MPSKTEVLTQHAYTETAAFYEAVASKLGPNGLFYRIMYGPPVADAPIVFLGYQPGGGLESAERERLAGEHASWPAECVYASAPWLLARRMRYIWGEPLLRQCTGLNANFFRAKSVSAWHSIDGDLRCSIEAFCLDHAERIVRAITPNRAVVIGLATFDRLARDGHAALRSDKRILVKAGDLWGTPALGIPHLSGSRISKTDLDRIAKFMSQ